MKKIIYSTLFLAVTHWCLATNVPVATAKLVATNFLHEKQKSSTGKNSLKDLNLTFTKNLSGSRKADPVYYIFSAKGKGFVIVSGDDAVQPILAYSTENDIDLNNPASGVNVILESYYKGIEHVKLHDIVATEAIKSAWNNTIANISNAREATTTATVNPLLTTTWDQHPYYNSYCPGGSVTGCVATTMAQIMKYWNYPAKGEGNHSYMSNYGMLSVNFAATSYNWSNMPNSISGSNTDIANLMYQCGVSVNMNYSPSGSGAFVIGSGNTAQTALSAYFGYNPCTMQGLYRGNYTDAVWINLLKNEMNASRPIAYVGYDNSGSSGHAWVMDGYDASDKFHMNWGWGGGSNGYHSINICNPPSINVTLNAYQQALIGIQPSNFSFIAPSPSNPCVTTASGIFQVSPVACASSYTWSYPNGWTGPANTTTPQATVYFNGKSGMGSIICTANTPNGIVSASKSVTVSPLVPTLSTISVAGANGYLCPQQDFYLVANGNGISNAPGLLYHWTIASIPYLTSDQELTINGQSGTRNVSVYCTSTGCGSTSNTISRNITGLSFNAPQCQSGLRDEINSTQNMEDKSNTTIYPNPSNGEISFLFATMDEMENADLTIYSSDGRLILSQKINANKVDLNLKDVNAGLYFARIVKSNGEVINHKIVISTITN